jgi:hypothetical protein
MDNLADNFGGLSTTAREWKPGGVSTQSNNIGSSSGSQQEWQGGDDPSELNAAAVKEFVPGKGWSTTTPAGGSSAPQHQGESFKRSGNITPTVFSPAVLKSR